MKYNPQPKDSIKILYVTCGMIIIQYGRESIFFDPFFSYQSARRIPFRIRSSKAAFQDFIQLTDATIDKKSIVAGFVSHAHYDHLMDLPLLLQTKAFPNLQNVYGSEFFQQIMFHQRNNGVNLLTLNNEEIFNPLTPEVSVNELSISENISVLPIASMHAPHKFGVTMMNGKIDSLYFQQKKFTDPYAKSKGFKWDAGCSYSFLVKLKNSEGKVFKILVQTSASNEPYGLPPTDEKIDLAVLCFASIQEVNNYPDFIMQKTEAKKLLLIHWEDFFRIPKNPNDVRLVRGTSIKIARRQLDGILRLTPAPEIKMPKPGTLIKISY